MKLHPVRRALAGVLTAALIGFGLVLGIAGPASAHTLGLSGEAQCVKGVLTVTWTGTTADVPQGVTATITDSTATPAGSTLQLPTGPIDRNASFTVIQTGIPSTATSATLSLTLTWSNGYTKSTSKTITVTKTCEVPTPKTPTVSLVIEACYEAGHTGTVRVSLDNLSVGTVYTVTLSKNGSAVGGPQSTSGTATTAVIDFTGMTAGSYSATAVAGGFPSVTATSQAKELTECSPPPPEPKLEVRASACLAAGDTGLVSVALSDLALGTSYTVQLFQDGVTGPVGTATTAGTASTATVDFPGHGAGTYYAVATAVGQQSLTATSNPVTIGICQNPPTVQLTLSGCAPLQTVRLATQGYSAASSLRLATIPGSQTVTVVISGIDPNSTHTITLRNVDDDSIPIDGVVTLTADGSGVITHDFVGVPTPANYRAELPFGNSTVASTVLEVPECGFDDVTPQVTISTLECDTTGQGIGALSYHATELDPTQTYRVTITLQNGDPVLGQSAQDIPPGSTEHQGLFEFLFPENYRITLESTSGPAVSASGDAVIGDECIPTLALTGASQLMGLGIASAVLLLLGGVTITGRLRRRMSL